ncbi:MAG: hypothetical protein RL090_770 [Bacteroidota bacterium]
MPLAREFRTQGLIEVGNATPEWISWAKNNDFQSIGNDGCKSRPR